MIDRDIAKNFTDVINTINSLKRDVARISTELSVLQKRMDKTDASQPVVKEEQVDICAHCEKIYLSKM